MNPINRFEAGTSLISRIEPGSLRTNDALARNEERERRRRRRERSKKEQDREEHPSSAEDAESVLDLVA